MKKNNKEKGGDIFEIFFSRGEFFSNQKKAFELKEKSCFGEKKEDKIVYSGFEAVYLLEKKKAELISGRKTLNYQKAIEKIMKKDKKFLISYIVFKDLRNKGYIIKTALKFGVEFRVYEKGKHPKKEHSKYLLFPVKESEKVIWQNFVAKNRVAHSTKKNLLIAIVDDEQDISYYEIKWIKT